jgi:hypothetical protein
MKKHLLTAVSLMLLPGASVGAAVFSDVDENIEYVEAIGYLAERGIVSGFGDGRFGPEETLTRAELLKILLEADEGFEVGDYSGELDCFADVMGYEWYAPYVCYAKEMGIVEGFGDGNFRPNEEVALAGGAKMIGERLGIEEAEIEVGEEAEWYEVYVRALTEQRAIPRSVASLGQKLERAEMAEMMYRVLENETLQEEVETGGEFVTFAYLESKEVPVLLGEGYVLKNGLVYYFDNLSDQIDGETFQLFHVGYDCGVDKDNIVGFGVPLEPDDDPVVREWLENFEEWDSEMMKKRDISSLLRKDDEENSLTGNLVIKYTSAIDHTSAKGRQAGYDILNKSRLCTTALAIKHRGYNDIPELSTASEFFSYSVWSLFPQWSTETIHYSGGGWLFIKIPFGDLEYISSALNKNPWIRSVYPEKDSRTFPN